MQKNWSDLLLKTDQGGYIVSIVLRLRFFVFCSVCCTVPWVYFGNDARHSSSLKPRTWHWSSWAGGGKTEDSFHSMNDWLEIQGDRWKVVDKLLLNHRWPWLVGEMDARKTVLRFEGLRYKTIGRKSSSGRCWCWLFERPADIGYAKFVLRLKRLISLEVWRIFQASLSDQ